MGFVGKGRTSNVELPILNIEWWDMAGEILETLFGCFDGSDEDANELVGFVEEVREVVGVREDFGFLNKEEPAV